jgi:hypothetical protein
LAISLAGCGTIETATQPSGEIQMAGESPDESQTEPGPSPLDWLAQSEFVPHPQQPPEVAPADLPQDFVASEERRIAAQTPTGFALNKVEVIFEHAVGGQVTSENQLTLEAYSYAEVEGRSEHLTLIAGQGYSWEYREVDGRRIARYSTASTDGRAWVSGPYLIVIYGGLDTAGENPWLDIFVSLLLELFPAQ